MIDKEVTPPNEEMTYYSAYRKGYHKGWEARDKILPKWVLATYHNVSFFLKDHYWYLIIDPRFNTPMKGKWHDDTYSFTYEYAGDILDTINIIDVLAFKELPSCEDVCRIVDLYINEEDEGDE